MTHSDIYTKFLIEYDKANITSSYPSLTIYEVATMLDKAYLALIAQKLTGNNPRGAAFESDTKSIEDIRQLIIDGEFKYIQQGIAKNEFVYKINEDMLYYVSAVLLNVDIANAIDNQMHVILNVQLISHEDALKFRATSDNLPWMSSAMAYIQGKQMHILVDSYVAQQSLERDYFIPFNLICTYVHKPDKFVDCISDDTFTGDFELSDTMAEELINLAIIMSLETVESTRLTTKIQTRPLES